MLIARRTFAFVAFLSTLVFTCFSNAGEKPEEKIISKIEADFRCESEADGGVAMSMPRDGQPPRLWVTTQTGSAEGQEIPIKSFRVARCPGCFEYILGYEKEEIKVSVSNYRLTLSLAGREGKWSTLWEAICVPQK